jgi:hypothetical protein
MLFRPATKPLQRLNQGATQGCQPVFDFWRHDGMHRSLHQPVAFEGAQGLSEHLLRNTADLALKRGVTHGSTGEYLNDKRGPFIRDPVKHKSGRAPRVQNRRRTGLFRHVRVCSRIPWQAQVESNVLKVMYSLKSYVVDGWFGRPKFTYDN